MLSVASPISFVLSKNHHVASAWYGDVLGLVKLSDDPFATTFRLGGEESTATLRLTTVPDFKPSLHSVLGFHVSPIDTVMASLKEKGVSFIIYEGFGQDEKGVWASPDGHYRLAWFNDPEGNNLSLIETK